MLLSPSHALRSSRIGPEKLSTHPSVRLTWDTMGGSRSTLPTQSPYPSSLTSLNQDGIEVDMSPSSSSSSSSHSSSPKTYSPITPTSHSPSFSFKEHPFILQDRLEGILDLSGSLIKSPYPHEEEKEDDCVMLSSPSQASVPSSPLPPRIITSLPKSHGMALPVLSTPNALASKPTHLWSRSPHDLHWAPVSGSWSSPSVHIDHAPVTGHFSLPEPPFPHQP
ncbi:MAG: hypothetical protein DHS80DRAFT_24073 [Piptocephalis tieghemiana]|nr:MAG: hypothetical protein DHS80DRAFT_24073 [Piptocephalis tieghemiana]